jgi:hypothetical protein
MRGWDWRYDGWFVLLLLGIAVTASALTFCHM